MAAEPQFAHEIVQEGVNDGYWVMPIDVDGDGRPDLVTSGLALGEVAWFRNPDWRRRVIGNFSRPVSLDQADIDGDGRTDLVVCHDYAPTMFEATPQDGRVSWLRNAGERDEPWQVRPIGQLGSAHRLRLGHFTDPEELQVLVAPVVGPRSGMEAVHTPIRVVLYRRPDDVLAASSWPADVADDESFRVIHAIALGEYGAPGAVGLGATLLASEEGLSWFGVNPDGRWEAVLLGHGEPGQAAQTGYRGSGNHAVGRIGGDPYAYIAAVEPFHGNTLAVYTPEGDGDLAQRTWRRTVLETFGDPNEAGEGPAHHVVCADFDGDGDDEFLVALRGPMPHQGVFHYRPVDAGAARFEKTRVSEPSAARIAVADFDGDDRLDFATTGYHVPGYFECEDPQVVVHFNHFGEPIAGPAIPLGPLGG